MVDTNRTITTTADIAQQTPHVPFIAQPQRHDDEATPISPFLAGAPVHSLGLPVVYNNDKSELPPDVPLVILKMPNF